MTMVFYVLLYTLCVVGLGILAPLWTNHSPVVRKVLLAVSLLVVNLGALIVLGSGYLVSRLEGSMPPSLFQYLSAFWLPVTLIVLVDLALIAVYLRKRAPAA